MNIKPVSSLRNYKELLQECEGGPIFLTNKQGKGAFVLMAIRDYNKLEGEIKLLSKLLESETSVAKGEKALTVEELKKKIDSGEL
ncbi:MAG: type II toxin-antitoxin system Phd/YefM family antitoxin [Christensenellaceae bacterium]